jgi:hypothetical protein
MAAASVAPGRGCQPGVLLTANRNYLAWHVSGDGVGRRTQAEATQRFLVDAPANGMAATVGGLIKADLAIFVPCVTEIPAQKTRFSVVYLSEEGASFPLRSICAGSRRMATTKGGT